MAWLRIDDGFMENPKIENLTAHELQVWLRVLCRGARQRSGDLPAASTRFVTGLTRPRLRRFVELELLDETTAGYEIHDWAIYNPGRHDPDELDRRVQDALERFPGASMNELVAVVGGRRKDALAAIHRFREPDKRAAAGGSGNQDGDTEQVVPGTKREPAGTGSGNQTGTGSRARARARDARTAARARPVPYPEDQEPSIHPPVAKDASRNGRMDGNLEQIDPHAELDRLSQDSR